MAEDKRKPPKRKRKPKLTPAKEKTHLSPADLFDKYTKQAERATHDKQAAAQLRATCDQTVILANGLHAIHAQLAEIVKFNDFVKKQIGEEFTDGPSPT